VKSFALAVSAFHRICLLYVHLFHNPALHAVRKRRGFYKTSLYPEFPAVDAEPAVRKRLFFVRKALHLSFNRRENPVLLICHGPVHLFYVILCLSL
jgi:hypothetical protein